jgi:hypothetical protein
MVHRLRYTNQNTIIILFIDNKVGCKTQKEWNKISDGSQCERFLKHFVDVGIGQVVAYGLPRTHCSIRPLGHLIP